MPRLNSKTAKLLRKASGYKNTTATPPLVTDLRPLKHDSTTDKGAYRELKRIHKRLSFEEIAITYRRARKING